MNESLDRAVPYALFTHMTARRLTTLYLRALDLARPTLADVAAGARRGRRTLQAYGEGVFQVTPRAARDLARYLRRQARVLDRTADALESVAKQEEERKR